MPTRHRILSSFTALFAAIVIAALIVVVPSPLLAQQSTAAPKPVAKAAPQAEEEESPTAQKPGQEGIKVHGHLIIDVKDKDGNVVKHMDFQNSLVDTNLLTLLLTGQAVMNSLSVGIGTSGTDSYYLYPPTSTAVSPLSTGCTSGAPTCNANLTITTLGTVTTQGPRLTGIKLAGQFVPTNNVTVTTVLTNFAACSVSPVPSPGVQYYVNSPAQCAAQSYSNVQGTILSNTFTATSASPLPLSVAAGQTVSVTVTLSFS